MFHVRHDHMDGLIPDERCESRDTEQNLAAGHRLLDPATNLARLFDLLRWHGLLVPGQSMWLEPMSYSLRERDVEVTVAIDHELDIWPNRIPHGSDGSNASFYGRLNGCRR